MPDTPDFIRQAVLELRTAIWDATYEDEGFICCRECNMPLRSATDIGGDAIERHEHRPDCRFTAKRVELGLQKKSVASELEW